MDKSSESYKNCIECQRTKNNGLINAPASNLPMIDIKRLKNLSLRLVALSKITN